VQHHGQAADHDVPDTGVIQRIEQWLEERHERILAYSRCPGESAATGVPGQAATRQASTGRLKPSSRLDPSIPDSPTRAPGTNSLFECPPSRNSCSVQAEAVRSGVARYRAGRPGIGR
jgi:hypothetical protein